MHRGKVENLESNGVKHVVQFLKQAQLESGNNSRLHKAMAEFL